jgi:hypothetical protein
LYIANVLNYSHRKPPVAGYFYVPTIGAECLHVATHGAACERAGTTLRAYFYLPKEKAMQTMYKRFCSICGKEIYDPGPETMSCGSKECMRKLWRESHPLLELTNEYVFVKMSGHPRANSSGMILEHIVEAEKKYGRPVAKSEIVHHLNGNKADNHHDNLVILTKSEHNKAHANDFVFWQEIRNEDTGYSYEDTADGHILYFEGVESPRAFVAMTVHEAWDIVGKIKTILREKYGILNEHYGGQLSERLIVFDNGKGINGFIRIVSARIPKLIEDDPFCS